MRRPLSAPVLGLLCVCLALGMVAFFDLQTNTSFNDEYARRWTIERFVAGKGLALWGLNAGLVQILASVPLALLHLEPRYWRLPAAAFLAMGAFYSYRIAIVLGADRFWASISAAAVSCAPLSLALATGFMNESGYFGLLMAAAYYDITWLQADRWRLACIAMVGLATLQREQGAGLAIALVGALLIARRRRALNLDSIAWVAALLVVTLVALRLPSLFRPLTTLGLVRATDVGLDYYRRATIALPVLLGLLMTPFAGMLLLQHRDRQPRDLFVIAPLALAAVGVIGSIGRLLFGASIFVGNYLNFAGLGPVSAAGLKANLLPVWLFVLVEAVATGTYLVVLVQRRSDWTPSRLGTERLFLVLVSASQFAAILLYTRVIDRYYVLVAAPIAPILAMLASQSPVRQRWETVGRAWAAGALIAGLLLYGVGEQDYVAWQIAKDQAMNLALGQTSAEHVDGGFEETATHIWIPAVDNPGSGAPTSVVDPLFTVYYAPAGDPHPGFEYNSIQPGKMVIAPSTTRTLVRDGSR